MFSKWPSYVRYAVYTAARPVEYYDHFQGHINISARIILTIWRKRIWQIDLQLDCMQPATSKQVSGGGNSRSFATSIKKKASYKDYHTEMKSWFIRLSVYLCILSSSDRQSNVRIHCDQAVM